MPIDLKDLGQTPIPGANPSGSDIRYEPEFEWLQKEIGKLGAPILKKSEGGQEAPTIVYEEVDWDKVINTCRNFLETKSKDIRVVGWLIQGLMATRGAEGLQNGLEIFWQTCSTFWDSLYPDRARVRASATTVMTKAIMDRLQGKADGAKPSWKPGDSDFLNESAQLVSKLNEFFREKLSDAPVTMNLFHNELKDQAERAASPAPALRPQPAAPSVPSATVAAPGAAPPPPQPTAVAPKDTPIYEFDKPGDRKKYFDDLKATARILHDYGRKNLPHDSVGYKWIRMVYWSPVKFSADTPFLPLKGPNEVLQRHLAGLYEQKRFDELFIAAEGHFVEYWFWLDIQRYVIESAGGLGEQYLNVKEAILDELRFFLRRMPFFATMQTQDRFALANADTAEWLRDTVLTGSDNYRLPVVGHQEAIQSAEADDSESLTFNSNEPVSNILEVAKERLSKAADGRGAFQVRLQLIQCLLAKTELELAWSLMEAMLNDLDRYKLEVWETDLALSALHLKFQCCRLLFGRSKKDDKIYYKDQMRLLLPRIAGLDPVMGGELAKNIK